MDVLNVDVENSFHFEGFTAVFAYETKRIVVYSPNVLTQGRFVSKKSVASFTLVGGFTAMDIFYMSF